MSKYIYLLLIAVLFVGQISYTQVVSAHDLVPTAVSKYIENNPNATAEEIRSVVTSVAGSAKRLVEASNPETDILTFVTTFILLGIEHILSGIDHVLFILALILTAYSIRQVSRLSIAFTVAHSITFILAGTTALTLSSRIVEPLIAFSIAVVALLGLSNKYKNSGTNVWYSLVVIFVFGLFHGLGFAGLLQDLQLPEDNFMWSLILFNVGIELGQIIIIIPVFLLLLRIRRLVSWPEIHTITAYCIASIGIIWCIQRIFYIV